MPTEIVLLVHAATTWAMTGLIWFVQLTHYPLFEAVAREDFVVFERRHQQRTTWIVAPLMVSEWLSGIALCANPPAAHWVPWLWFGLGALFVVWASTAFVQIPLHKRLSSGFDEQAHRSLVRSNWIRTVAWTIRTLIVSRIVFDSMKSP